MKHTDQQNFVIKLADDLGNEVGFTIPHCINYEDITTDTTVAVLNAAKEIVTGGGTLVQTKVGTDVTKVSESYIEITSKTWIDDPVV